MEDTVELNLKGLTDFIKSLKNPPQARVGILGSNNARSESKETNASIGAKHEYGMDGMPMRSFLRVPIIENMQKYLEQSNAFDEDTLKQIMQTGSILEWVKQLGFTAEQIVLDAFQSGGFGKWKPSNMTYKKNHQTLVETQQLRNSITSEVK